MIPLRVLIGGEYSGIERDAFIAAGHDAISCDYLPTERPGPHYQGDMRDIIGNGFDLAIFHPTCQYLANSGVQHLYKQPLRWQHMIEAAVFFRELLNAPIPKVCVENPIMHKWARQIVGVRQTQVIQPWMHGVPEKKAIALWLRGLSPLVPTNDVRKLMATLPIKEQQRVFYASPGPERWKVRSTSFDGVAKAMATQWGAPDLLSAA